MSSARVAGFLPAAGGLHFPNAFPNVPLVALTVLGHGAIPIGDAANGLCGGMAFAVRDCFEAHRAPPPDVLPPASGTTAFDYLVRRLVDSFDLPAGPVRFYEWMSRPDADSPAGPGVATLTRREVAVVRAALDRGELCPLGLIRTSSSDPRDLGKNHQVLAYGHDVDDATGRCTLELYDPNHPDLEVTLSCVTTTGAPLELAYSTGEPTRGFFATPYQRADPSPLFGTAPSRLAWIGSVARIFGRLFGARA